MSLSPGPRGPPLWLRELRRGKRMIDFNKILNESKEEREERRKRIDKMVLMSADLNDASVLGALPKDWYVARITAIEDTKSNKTSAPMLNVTLTIQAGSFVGKRVFPPDHIMLGGTTEKGDKQDLRRLCDYINATGIEWKCVGNEKIPGCGVSGARRKFIKDDRSQKYLCPDCRQATGFAYDTDHFLNKDVKILLDQEKGFNSDEMVNRISRITELN